MAEASYIDLISLLRAFKEGMKGCTLYGRIIESVGYPDLLQPNVRLDDNGMFVVIEVFAVSVGKYESYLREHGLKNKDGVYMVNGNALAYVNKRAVVGADWYQISGTLRSPSRNKSSNCIALFDFYKDGNDWCLNPCRVDDLDISTWDRHSAAYAWINASGDANQVKHPPEVLALPRFESFDQVTTPVQVNQQPKEETAVTYKTVKAPATRFNKENRESVKECSDYYDTVRSLYEGSIVAKHTFIESLLSKYSIESDTSEYLTYTINGILNNFTNKRSPYSLTGRALLRKYLSSNSMSEENYIGTRTAGEYLVDIFSEIYPFITDNTRIINADGKALDLCRAMFGDKEAFYAGIVGVVIGIPTDTVEDIVSFCNSRSLSITKILNENPYMLQFFSSLSMDEIERIAMCFGKHESQELSRYRNMVLLNAHITDTNDGSTVYKASDLLGANIGVRLTKARFDKVKVGQTYLTDAMATNIDTFICSRSNISTTYSPNGFKPIGGAFVRCLSKDAINRAISDYVATGLGIVDNDYIASSDMAKKELFVFDTMRKMASKTYDYKKEDIDTCIREYESQVGFKLEDAQVKAVHLLVNGAFVVAGSAGSGKTTVSRCVVYTLRKLSPLLDIKFAAPTGKAAKRMQEVVQEEVRTLHSMFHLSTAQDNLFFEEDSDNSNSNTAFFFDESAMLTIDLMYRVLRNVDVDSSRIYMFGDFHQLQPIGKGLPFKNLLRFMPCVFLEVVKRAAEGSNITANSYLVNECSDSGRWQWLRNGKDFFMLECGGEQIQVVVRDLCAHYLGRKRDSGKIARALGLNALPDVTGLTPDDIQVVSPLTKENYSWGATALNQVLQPLFNPEHLYAKTFVYQVTKMSKASKFVIGDRVIHTEKNMYSMQWYGSYKDGVFRKIYGQGICNGEVGRIVGFLPVKDAMFLEEAEHKPDDFEYTDSVRHDESWGSDNCFFVVVEYYDSISARNFYILYRAEQNSNVQSNEGIVLKGDDIQKLNLFYAGTTHKLQGSQAKLVICVLDNITFKGFITRQMVYTMMTRAEKLCFMVGSVGNSQGSMLTQARLDISSANTLTLGELLV